MIRGSALALFASFLTLSSCDSRAPDARQAVTQGATDKAIPPSPMFAPSADLREAALKHREWLMGKAAHRSELMHKFVMSAGELGFDEAMSSVPPAELSLMLSVLVHAVKYSRQSHGAMVYGYVVQPEALDILLAMLGRPRSELEIPFEAKLRELGIRLLGDWCFQEDIERYSGIILSRLGPPPYDEGNARENEQAWRLYGRLRLDEEANRLLKKPLALPI